jgi:hypothetical protein
MNENLNMLRQNYCRPATVTCKANLCLFPLEKECDQGKSLLAKAPKKLLDLQEFNPSGLEQTYREESSGADLPLYALFDLERTHKIAFEITVDSVPAMTDRGSLLAHMPFKKTQEFVKNINERRTKAERVVTQISVIVGIMLGMVPAAGYIFSQPIGMASGLAPFMLLGGSAFGALVAYVFGVSVLRNRKSGS